MAEEKTILDIVNLASSIRDKHCRRLGVPFRGEGLLSLTSGLDVALTVMEESMPIRLTQVASMQYDLIHVRIPPDSLGVSTSVS